MGRIRRLICGAVRAFWFPELCVNCWWPPGNHVGHETLGAAGEMTCGKAQLFPWREHLAHATLSIPEPLRRLADTSPPYTPWDKTDGRTEAGMKGI